MSEKKIEDVNKGLFIRRSDAIDTIEKWADKNEGKVKREPDKVARIMASKIKAVRGVEVDPVYYGTLRKGFTGMNYSEGECGHCGARLIWRTQNPLNGCPYCFFRFK